MVGAYRCRGVGYRGRATVFTFYRGAESESFRETESNFAFFIIRGFRGLTRIMLGKLLFTLRQLVESDLKIGAERGLTPHQDRGRLRDRGRGLTPSVHQVTEDSPRTFASVGVNEVHASALKNRGGSLGYPGCAAIIQKRSAPPLFSGPKEPADCVRCIDTCH